MSERFRAGDVIARTTNGGTVYRYIVVGFSSRGKLRLRRDTGTEDAAWWDTPDHLPPNYFLERKAA